MENQKNILESFGGMNFNKEITQIINVIAEGSVEISDKLGMANLNEGELESSGQENCQGEEANNFDIYANDLLMTNIKKCDAVSKIISEENSSYVSMLRRLPKREYIVAIDPLDGSSNVDVNIPVGTIFAIYEGSEVNSQVLSGDNIVAAGYVVYGSSLQLVLSDGIQTNIFVYKVSDKGFKLAIKDFKTPKNGKIYSVNEGNFNSFDQQNQEFICSLKEKEGFTARYAGSLVADFHRNLIKGGIYLYPSTDKHVKGKLRVLYECFPLAFIIKACGGKCISDNYDTLNKSTFSCGSSFDIHQRSNLVIGSIDMVTEYMSFQEDLFLKLA